VTHQLILALPAPQLVILRLVPQQAPQRHVQPMSISAPVQLQRVIQVFIVPHIVPPHPLLSVIHLFIQVPVPPQHVILLYMVQLPARLLVKPLLVYQLQALHSVIHLRIHLRLVPHSVKLQHSVLHLLQQPVIPLFIPQQVVLLSVILVLVALHQVQHSVLLLFIHLQASH